MKVWELTNLGSKLARATNNPDTPAWRVVHHLDFIRRGTTDQIASGSRLELGETAGMLASLQRKGIVKEAGQTGGFE